MQVMRTAWHCRRMSAVGQAEISADPKWTSLKRDQLAVFVRPSFRRSSHALGLSDLTAGHGCEFRALLETLTYANGGDSFSKVAQLLQTAFGAAQVDAAGQSADRRCRYLDEPKSNLNFRSLGARQLKMMQAMPISDHLVRGEIRSSMTLPNLADRQRRRLLFRRRWRREWNWILTFSSRPT